MKAQIKTVSGPSLREADFILRVVHDLLTEFEYLTPGIFSGVTDSLSKAFLLGRGLKLGEAERESIKVFKILIDRADTLDEHRWFTGWSRKLVTHLREQNTLEDESVKADFEVASCESADSWPTRVNVKPIAEKVLNLIVKKQASELLIWSKGKDQVRVNIGLIFPDGSGYKRTIAGRRARFRRELERGLHQAGWKVISRSGHRCYRESGI